MATELRTRALVICGLSSIAVAQPLLDLFGNNPEFFVAGNYSTAQIVWFALVVTLVPPAIGVAITAAAMAIDRRAGTIAFAAVVAAFGAAIVLAVLRTAGLDPVVAVIALAVVGAAGLVYLVLRTRGARLLASYLAAANLAFLGLFLFTSPASELVAGSADSDLGEVDVPEIDGPVVVIVLDEFPAATIMRPDGTINAERYPAFAELASVSTWFRNASSLHNLTHRAVPAILDGRVTPDGVLPTYADHPRNLFTMLGGSVPVVRYESVTQLCPTEVCEPPPAQPLTQALEDASIVYGHRVLPGSLRDSLPPIDNSWGAYGAQEERGAEQDDDEATADTAEDGTEADEPMFIQEAYSRWLGMAADERSPLGQAAMFTEQVAAITGDPALHFVHVALPHRPWVLSRTGVAASWAPTLVRDPADPAYDFENRMEYQFHAMQVGAVDALLGDLLDQLQRQPTWEDALLVVTSDHGSNLTPPDLGRMKLTDANIDEALRVPLFVKAPGQTSGEFRDDAALTIDVLPTIADLLGVETDWEFDGHSLFDGSEPTVEPRVSPDVGAVIDIATRRAEEFPHGDDWTALAAVGEYGDLVGGEVGEFTTGEPSEFTATIDQADQFSSLPTADNEMPFGMTGTIEGAADPPELVIAVNGRIAGVTGGYRPDGDGWTWMAFVGEAYREGGNEVELFEVARAGGDVTLRPVG